MKNDRDGTSAELTMELREYLGALRAFWWIPCALALSGFVGGWFFAPAAPYESMFRATVVMAGDTENPGSAERPELMILDDLLSLVESQAYAELTLGAIPADQRGDLTASDIQGSLGESRYGRVATVLVRGSNPDEVAVIAPAAASVFSGAVNTYLVAPGSQPASVQLLDPPRGPMKSSTRRYLTIGAATSAMFALGMWVVWLTGSTQSQPHPGANSAQPESARSRAAKKSSR